MGSSSRVTTLLSSVDDEQRHLLRALSLGGHALQAETPSAPGQEGATVGDQVGVPAIDAHLPLGLPERGVIELAARDGFGGATRLALQLCAQVFAKAERTEEWGTPDDAWVAWIDPSGTLHAPGVEAAGVPLERLLVVRPEPHDVARVAVRLVASGQLARVVVQRTEVVGASSPEGRLGAPIRWDVAVRRLALASEQHGTSVVLLSDRASARRDALPTAMRIELARPRRGRVELRVTKDRRGGGIGRPFEVRLAELREASSPPPPPSPSVPPPTSPVLKVVE